MVEFHHVERYQRPQEPPAPTVLGERDHLVEGLRNEIRGDSSDEIIQNGRQTENKKEHEEKPGDEPMSVTEHCVNDVASIELANRDEVHRSNK